MNAIQTLDIKQLPVMIWKDMPVCTTEMLAQFYGCESKDLRENFANRKGKFHEGKHYFTLQGAELRAFQSCAGKTGSPFAPSKFATKVNLWTERGAARHAKILDNDESWDVWEEMEDAYFRSRAGNVDAPKSTEIALATEIGHLKDMVRARDAIIQAKDQAIVGLQGELIGSLRGENRLLKRVSGLERQQARKELIQTIERMELAGHSRADIAAATGKSFNYIRQRLYIARQEGRLPPLQPADGIEY